MNKVLFLDFDGVLGPGSFVFRYTDDSNRGRQAKEQIRRVIETTGCLVVISSTWRRGLELDTLRDMLVRCGAVPHRNLVIGATPILAGMRRGDEIREWLENNTWVDRFAIVDDKDDAIKATRTRFLGGKYHRRRWEIKTYVDKRLARRYVQPRKSLGTTQDDADELIRILGEK